MGCRKLGICVSSIREVVDGSHVARPGSTRADEYFRTCKARQGVLACPLSISSLALHEGSGEAMSRTWMRSICGIVGLGGALVRSPSFLSSSAAHADAVVRAEDQEDSGLDLLLVHVVMRHGARTPLRTLLALSDPGAEWSMCDPVIKSEFLAPISIEGVAGSEPGKVRNADASHLPLAGGCFPGELTELGCQQLKDFGSQLRSTYIQSLKFLSETFEENEILVRSTFQQRAVESARSLLSGLYPAENRSDHVPVHIHDMYKENIYPNTHLCPRLRSMFRTAREKWSSIPESEEILAQVELLLGEDLSAPHIHLNDWFVGRKAHGLELPEEMTPRLVAEVGRLAVREVLELFEEKDSIKLSIGPLWREIRSTQEEVIQGDTEQKKLIIYSGHDTTLIPMLLSLKVFDGQWPAFASNVIVELLRSRATGEHHVRVLYNGQEQSIPGCDSPTTCKYDRFLEVLGEVIQDAGNYDCHDESAHTMTTDGTTFDQKPSQKSKS